VKRTIALIIGVAAFVVVSKLLLEDVLGMGLEPLAERWLDRAGPGSAALVVGLLVADILLPVPSSFVMVFSGAAFGVVTGSALALVGSIAGEWLGFELVRRHGRGLATRLVGADEIDNLSGFFARYGTSAVIMTRPLPIVMETISIIAGLSGMSRARFVGASLAGTAPIVIVYAYAGAVSRQVGSVVPALVMLATVMGAGWMWFRAVQGQRPKAKGPTTPSPPSSATSLD
jgi:uncharacterized membrane protein YdjX (TVP38/TMEM64 family)